MAEPLKEITHKFLGGAVYLKPATSFQGKSGTVNLPDRIVLKLEGQSTTLTIEALDALLDLAEQERAQPFLEALRNAAIAADEAPAH